MRNSFAAVLCSAVIGALALSAPAHAKTAKECEQEWQANKAANQAKKITEKAYVTKCRSDADAAAPKAADSKSKTAAPADKPAKEKSAEKPSTTAGTKTVKACEQEWRANKAANQAAGVTEKSYVEKCRSGASTADTKPTAPAAPKEKEKAAAPMAPAATAAKPAPASGSPSGANQYAAEIQAKARCPRDTVVWANLDSKIYHFAGHNDYGHTKTGAYMCEKDATGQGMRAAKNEKHP